MRAGQVAAWVAVGAKNWYNLFMKTPETKKKLAVFFSNKFLLINFLLAAFLNTASWFLLLWRIKPSSEPIPLHYNVYFGLDLIGPWQQAFWVSALGTIFLILNYFLAWQVYPQEKALTGLLAGLTTLLELFLLVGALVLVLINI